MEFRGSYVLFFHMNSTNSTICFPTRLAVSDLQKSLTSLRFRFLLRLTAFIQKDSPFCKLSVSETDRVPCCADWRSDPSSWSAVQGYGDENWHDWTSSGKYEVRICIPIYFAGPSCLRAYCYFQQLPEAMWKTLLETPSKAWVEQLEVNCLA